VTGATHFYADARDTEVLLDFLQVGTLSSLRPWPLIDPAAHLSRPEAGNYAHVLVAADALGDPVFIRKDDAAMTQSTASGVFNRLNLERLARAGVDQIVDLDASPVLFWSPGAFSVTELRVGSLGTQAHSPRAVSADYDRWVKRVAAWIRRRGTLVWGLQKNEVRPDLDIHLRMLNSVYALPGALEHLTNGSRGR